MGSRTREQLIRSNQMQHRDMQRKTARIAELEAAIRAVLKAYDDSGEEPLHMKLREQIEALPAVLATTVAKEEG